jgi:predicted DCC family thiol-disulfide oxidoreductase YuxK
VNGDIRVGCPPLKPLIIYDGDCGFCQRWIHRWRRIAGAELDFRSGREESIWVRFPELSRWQWEQAMVLVEPDGVIFQGAAALFRGLRFTPANAQRKQRGAKPKEPWLWRFYEKAPVFARGSEWIYGAVARRRNFLARLTGWI